MRARPWLTLAALLAMGLLLWLGVWQLQRLAWKEALLARVQAARTAPAQDIGVLLASATTPAGLEYHNAYADCAGLGTAPFVSLYGLVEGRPGWSIVSACPIQSSRYDAVLVDRGFQSAEDHSPVTVEPGLRSVRVTGPLRIADTAGPFTPPHRDGRWFSRDIGGMAAALGVERPAPVMLASVRPVPEAVNLIAAPLPEEIANRHLEYALTWFGLAAVLAGVYAVLVFRPRVTA